MVKGRIFLERKKCEAGKQKNLKIVQRKLSGKIGTCK
jgi:hypothetical protein